jgi:hypothetical protein
VIKARKAPIEALCALSFIELIRTLYRTPRRPHEARWGIAAQALQRFDSRLFAGDGNEVRFQHRPLSGLGVALDAVRMTQRHSRGRETLNGSEPAAAGYETISPMANLKFIADYLLLVAFGGFTWTGYAPSERSAGSKSYSVTVRSNPFPQALDAVLPAQRAVLFRQVANHQEEPG